MTTATTPITVPTISGTVNDDFDEEEVLLGDEVADVVVDDEEDGNRRGV